MSEHHTMCVDRSIGTPSRHRQRPHHDPRPRQGPPHPARTAARSTPPPIRRPRSTRSGATCPEPRPTPRRAGGTVPLLVWRKSRQPLEHRVSPTRRPGTRTNTADQLNSTGGASLPETARGGFGRQTRMSTRTGDHFITVRATRRNDGEPTRTIPMPAQYAGPSRHGDRHGG